MQLRTFGRTLCAGASGLSLLFVVGCTSIKGNLPVAAAPQATGAFQAGAAKTDLTPMPGYPMGGHSIAGSIARGFWTRLWARAIYMEDASGNGLALVSCDLWSMPAGLADRVAELVAADPAGRHLGRGQLVLAATHTHQSPGNFSSCQMYNAHASREGGFDRGLFDFLALRITHAILEAVRTKQPARLSYEEGVVELVARNRSFGAFARNPEADGILQSNKSLPTGPRSAEFPTLEVYGAVDPTLKVLRIESAAEPSSVIALAAFFAVHPTSMSHEVEFYNSDLFGVAATLAEQKLRAAIPESATKPVVALFNGAEADISPACERQDRLNAVKLGKILGERILDLRKGGVTLEGVITQRFTNAPLANVGFTDSQGANRHTADYPLPGASQLGGAEDGRTSFYSHGYIEGLAGPSRGPHGVKPPALDLRWLWWQCPLPITRLALGKSAVPREVPLGVYQIGGPQKLTIATLPGEFTTVLGRRIAAEIATNLPTRESRIALVGLANEYVSYFTTPEEYDAQHYEGASMLYGPNAGLAVGHHLGVLARKFAEPPVQVPRTFAFSPGWERRFGVSQLAGSKPKEVEQAITMILAGQASQSFEWCDLMPEFAHAPHEDQPVVPRVSIEQRRTDGSWLPLIIESVPESNEGLDFVTLVSAVHGSCSKWRVLWLPPAAVSRESDLRFRVERLSGEVIFSDPFRLGP